MDAQIELDIELPAADIFFVGPPLERNNHVISSLEQQSQINVFQIFDPADKQMLELSFQTDRVRLVLFSTLWSDWSALVFLCQPTTLLALLDAPSNDGLALSALRQGARGVFNLFDEEKMLTRGIQQLLLGQLWFPRRILSQFMHELR